MAIVWIGLLTLIYDDAAYFIAWAWFTICQIVQLFRTLQQ